MDWSKIITIIASIIAYVTFFILLYKHEREEGFSWGFWVILLWIVICS